MADVVTMKQLLEAGVHFGHQTKKMEPKDGSLHFTQRMVFTSLTCKRLSRC